MPFTALDWILVLIAVVYAVVGFRRGFFLTLGSVLGFAGGGIAAFYLTPWFMDQVTGSWKVGVGILSCIVLLAVGQALGFALGIPLKRVVHNTGLGIIERVTGAALNVLALAVVVVILSFSAGQVGVPAVNTALDRSAVVTRLERATPTTLQQAIATARAAVLAKSNIPELSQQLFPQESAPTEEQDTPELEKAADSVLKINGTADACSQNQSGSGFVVSPGRVVTNAHVVAGVDDPVVETREGEVYEGTVVSYDPGTDLAVLSVPDLPVAPLATASNGSRGQLATFMGYPLGGPFSSKPATIQGLGMTATESDGHRQAPREIYQLAANVQQGNSGGPLLNDAGQVIGVIFAKATQGQTGYALSMNELDPVLQQASSLSAQVPSGSCTVE